MQHHIQYDFNKDYFEFFGKTKNHLLLKKNEKNSNKKGVKDSHLNDKFVQIFNYRKNLRKNYLIKINKLN